LIVQKGHGLVKTIVDLFKEHDDLIILVPPEGTRKKVTRWKTGFYYAALESGVPIVLGYLDYAKKITFIEPVFYPTGNIEKDFQYFREFYRNLTPKHPENFDPESVRPRD